MIRYFCWFFVFLLIAGCEMKITKDNTNTFVILDQTNNKVLNTYEYSADDNQLLRTESYNSNEEIIKGIDYEYDGGGNLTRTVEASKGSPVKDITYRTEDFFDNSGRLVKTVRTSSEGQSVETFYGYDDTGLLRGVVEQIDKSAVMMQDYDH